MILQLFESMLELQVVLFYNWKSKSFKMVLHLQNHGWPVQAHPVTMAAPASMSTSILSSVCAERVTMETYVNTVSTFLQLYYSKIQSAPDKTAKYFLPKS